jgi:hypothetical protein
LLSAASAPARPASTAPAALRLRAPADRVGGGPPLRAPGTEVPDQSATKNSSTCRPDGIRRACCYSYSCNQTAALDISSPGNGRSGGYRSVPRLRCRSPPVLRAVTRKIRARRKKSVRNRPPIFHQARIFHENLSGTTAWGDPVGHSAALPSHLHQPDPAGTFSEFAAPTAGLPCEYQRGHEPVWRHQDRGRGRQCIADLGGRGRRRRSPARAWHRLLRVPA